MVDVLVMVAAVAAVPILLRVGLGGGGRTTYRVRVRVPLRDRYPRLWWSGVLLGLVLAGVGWLADSCGWS
ncbi:hypothetical protein [Actinomadura litoris]|uniref:Uncharacterized protein n=1 Tax=Actinomadura litoris TaxID=2678616 RepID=A0A7K1LE82_9ACTN|nr:hypothetical protein [Actinomadura litoris]MUN42576.1 hypothetical protein [Actinomadura litoris]